MANQRAYAAIKAMAEMGFETGEVKLALEGLLKRTEDNWDYVQDNNYTALANSIFALQESGSTQQRTDSRAAMLLPLPERDRKGKRPLIQTEDHCILSKKHKTSVPQSDSKQGNQQTVSAIKSLEMMGFKEDVVMPLLKRLLKETDNNWDYIQQDNYSALVDVILHLDVPNNDNAATSSRFEQQQKGLKIKRAKCRQPETQYTSKPPLMTNAAKAWTSQAPSSTAAMSEASSSSMARGKVGLPILPQEKRAKRSASNELSEHVRFSKRAKVDAPSVFIANESVLSDPKEEENDYAELEDHDSIYWPSACDVPMPDEPEGERYMFEEWHRDKLDFFNKTGLIVLGSGEILRKTATHFLNLWSVDNLNKRGIGYNDNEAPDQLPKETPELYQRFVKGPIISESQLPDSSYAVNANDIEQGCHQGVVSSNGMVHQANKEPPINFNMSFSYSGRENPSKKNQDLVYCVT